MTEFDKVIPPGGVGKIKASISTDHFRGPISKIINVNTNDPDHRVTVLTLKAEVLVPIDVQPNENIMIQGRLSELKPAVVTISSTDGKPFDILKVESNPPLDVRVGPAPAPGAPAEATAVTPAPEKGKGKDHAKKGKATPVEAAATGPVAAGSPRYQITISVPTPVEVGRKFATVTLTTTHPKAASLPLRVNIHVRGAVEVVPERAFFSPVPLSESGKPTTVPAPQKVRIRKPDGSPLKIESATIKDVDFTATLKPIQEGREFELLIEYTGKPGRGWVTGEVALKTNEPSQPTLIVPFNGRF